MTSSLSRRPHRYLLIVENLPVPFDRRVWQQACTLRDAGHHVTVISPARGNYPPGTFSMDGILVHRHPLPLEASRAWEYPLEYAAALFWQSWLALKTYRQEGFEVIQIANPPDLLFLTALPYKALRVPLVYDQHDLAPELYQAKYNRAGFVFRVLRWFEACSYRLANHVLATNVSFRARALSRGVPPGRVTIVRNGPDLERLSRAPADLRLKRGKPYLLLYVGMMGEGEGINDLITIMHILRDRFDRRDTRLVLAGDGSARAPQEARALQLGLGDMVSFTGLLEDDSLVPLLNTADICLAPDPKNAMSDRSTMLKVMEYMAVGKPVIQYDLTEGRATAGEASLYARPGEPAHFAELLHGLLGNSQKRREMGMEGERRVREELQWERQVPQYLGVLESLLPR